MCKSLEENPQIKINNLKKQKYGYLIHTWSEKALKSTVVLSSCIEKGHVKLSLYWSQHFRIFTFQTPLVYWCSYFKDDKYWFRGLEGVVGEENAEEPRKDGSDDEVQDDDVPDEYDEDQVIERFVVVADILFATIFAVIFAAIVVADVSNAGSVL